MLKPLSLTFTLLALSVGSAQAAGDAKKGEKIFKRCKACHVVDSEKNKVGPHLVGILGRDAGMVEGFKYSKAMKESGISWDAESIDQYLADPRGFIPKNRMSFPGLKKEKDRADLIAYLESLQ